MRIACSRLVVVPGRITHSQLELAERTKQKLQRLPNFEARGIGFMYERSGIQKRHFELPLSDIDHRTDWLSMVNEATTSLSTRALDALTDEGPPLGSCDTLICVSSSFTGFPSVGRRLQERHGFPLDALVFDLSGLGCAGPTHALELADLLLRNGRERVCMLCADALGTHGESRRHIAPPHPGQLVAHCLASDAAAAMIVERGSDTIIPLLSWSRVHLKSHLWPSSLDQNDLTADADNQPFMAVGKDIRNRLTSELERTIGSSTLDEPLLLHPGGAALLDRVQQFHPRLAPSVEHSRSVLNEHGNVGGASLLLVLERALARGFPLEPSLHLFALGPGIVSSLLSIADVRLGRRGVERRGVAA